MHAPSGSRPRTWRRSRSPGWSSVGAATAPRTPCAPTGLAIPVYILLFPVYRIDVALGLFGTHLALILPYIAVTIPFNILLLTGFLRDFPEEIEQAAVVDGVAWGGWPGA